MCHVIILSIAHKKAEEIFQHVKMITQLRKESAEGGGH